MAKPEGGEPPDDDEPRRPNVVALIFIAALFAAAYWVFTLLEQHRETENCIASGRRDCIEIAPAGGRAP